MSPLLKPCHIPQINFLILFLPVRLPRVLADQMAGEHFVNQLPQQLDDLCVGRYYGGTVPRYS